MAGSTGTTGTGAGTEIVLVGADNGVVVVTSDTPLKRLNYFDGKFLRADDMRAEQEYLRTLVQLSNRAGGSGIVNGFDTTLAQGGAAVTVGQGLALDPKGRVLLMAITKTMLLDDLIAATAKAQKTLAASAAGSAEFADCVVESEPTAATSGQGADLYLLTVGFLEALCGEEDVFGQICDDACVQSKDRRWRMEGVLFRAVPLALETGLRVSSAVAVNPNQLRNRVASAYFEDERLRIASLIHGTTIRNSDAWCLGAQAAIGDAAPLAVFSRSGGVTKFLDGWTARRERMEAPPRRYWPWRLSMRPWDVFLAQVLQFQCQLRGILAGLVDGGAASDPCAPQTKALGKATELLGQLETWNAKWTSQLTELKSTQRLAKLSIEPFEIAAVIGLRKELSELAHPTAASTRILIDGGILDLPAAGYLPVDNSGKVTVNEQVRAFMGPGVDLRYCIVTPDYVPHALEMRQHMDRISLVEGIEDPTHKPKVDILVPGGRIMQPPLASGGTPFRMIGTSARLDLTVQGAANAAKRNATGGSFTLAGTSGALDLEKLIAAAKSEAAAAEVTAEPGVPAIAAHDVELVRTIAARFAKAPLLTDEERSHLLLPIRKLPDAKPGSVIAAVEATATIDDDPFQLDVSGTDVHLDLYFAPAGKAGSLVHLEARGLLHVSSKGDMQNGDEYASGSLSGFTVTVTGAGADWPGPDAGWTHLIRRTTTGGATTIQGALLVKKVPQASFSYTWSSSPLKGVLKVFLPQLTRKIQEKDTKMASVPAADFQIGIAGISAQVNPWLEIDLTQDPAVSDATESHHVLAESALTIIGAMLPNGADWQKAAEAALFPKPTRGADNITVLGDNDWVLFARRRLDTCTDEVVTEKPPNRRYHVYVHEAESADDAKTWVKTLLSDKGPERDTELRFVGFVEFDGTTDDVVDPTGLRNELRTVKAPVQYDVVGSDYGDGISGNARRRFHLEQSVIQVVDVTRAVPLDQGTLPAWFRGRIDGDEPVHGVVVLVVVPQIAVANVYLVSLALAQRVLFEQADNTKPRDPVDVTAIKDPAATLLLGPVTFRAGAPNDAELKSVADKWNDERKSKGFELARLVTVTAKAADDGAAETEKNAILMAVGKGPATIVGNTHATQGSFDVKPSTLNAMVFLVAGRGKIEPVVVLVRPEGAKEIKRLLDEGKVNEVLNTPTLQQFIETVPAAEYHPETATITNPGSIREAWKGAAGEAKPGAVMSFVAGDDTGMGKEIRAQAKSVGAALTASGSAPPVKVEKVADAPEPAAGAPITLYHFVLPK